MKRVILSYIKDVSQDIIYPFIKSISFFNENYDVFVFDTSINPNQKIINEINRFGIKIIKRKMIYENLFLDRFDAIKEFIYANDYDKILCLDFSDVYLQKNPFDTLDSFDDNTLIMTSEDILIKNQKWNYNIFLNVFGLNMLQEIELNPVLNGGVIFGDKKILYNFLTEILNEYNKKPDIIKKIVGVDQPIIMKVLYLNKNVNFKILHEKDALAIHFTTYLLDDPGIRGFENITILNNRIIKNSYDIEFSIVHQYKHSPNLLSEVLRHFK